jgi:hypothetical protein
MAEINGELRLVVLEAASGKLLWSQQLAHVDTQTILVDGRVRARARAAPLASQTCGAWLCACAPQKFRRLWITNFPGSRKVIS